MTCSRRSPWSLAALAASLSAALTTGLAGCGGSAGSPTSGGAGGGGGVALTCAAGTGPLTMVAGNVVYERLPLSVAGLGAAVITKPARFVDVELLDVGATTCFGRTSTDALGAYALVGNPPAGTTLIVRVASRTEADPNREVTVHDGLPPAANEHTTANCFFVDAPGPAVGTSATVDVTVPWNAGNPTRRPSIGFALLDVLLTCSERIRTTTGETPPQCHAYTQLGNAGATGTSFYSDASKALTILGGAAGNLDGSDTDYFDDGVIAHEYGHFVEFNMAASRNRGGPHGGESLEPPFAWSEGAATGWGCLLRMDSAYIDTVRTSPFPPQINANVENWTPQLVRGIGGEETVSEVVWDLGDGATGVLDADGDPAAVDFGTLYARFLAMDPAVVAPYLGTLLDALVADAGVPSGTIAALLAGPEPQLISYPLAGNDVWPVPLSIPSSVVGTCDSLPGFNKNPCRGLTSSVWYRFTLLAAQTLTFTLTIGPTGGNGDDLNLFLETVAGAPLAASQNGGASAEVIGPVALGPGHYVVRVEAECEADSNHANFTLQVN